MQTDFCRMRMKMNIKVNTIELTTATTNKTCMYEIRDRQDPVKGSRWVLFPSTIAEQPIQQMVVGHLCFQERAEQ